MGRSRSTRDVIEFLKIAKDSIKSGSTTRGIVTFGDGVMEEREIVLDSVHFWKGRRFISMPCLNQWTVNFLCNLSKQG